MKQFMNYGYRGSTPFCLFFAIIAMSLGIQSCSDKGKLHDGEFPIPYPEGGAVITEQWDGTYGSRTLKYPADRHSDLLVFYDDYASGSNWRRTEAGAGELPAVIYVNLRVGYTIDLAPPGDQLPDAVLLTLHVADNSGH